LFVHLDNKVTALQQEVSSLTQQVQSLNQQLRESQHMNAALGGGGSPLVGGASGLLLPAEPMLSLEARQDRARVVNASRFVTLSGRDGECVVDALPSDGPGAPWAGQMTVARLHTLTAAQVNSIIDHYNLERLEGKHAVPPGELKRRIYLIRFLGIPA